MNNTKCVSYQRIILLFMQVEMSNELLRQELDHSTGECVQQHQDLFAHVSKVRKLVEAGTANRAASSADTKVSWGVNGKGTSVVGGGDDVMNRGVFRAGDNMHCAALPPSHHLRGKKTDKHIFPCATAQIVDACFTPSFSCFFGKLKQLQVIIKDNQKG